MTGLGKSAGRIDGADFGQRVETRLSGGNIRNTHINLGPVLHFFPADAIGGSNKHKAAAKNLEITFSPGRVIHTDIDGKKKFLRERGAVADFFARSGAEEGDIVVIERTAPYAFTFSLRRAASITVESRR